MRTKRMTAALAVLLLMDLGLYYLVDVIEKLCIFWPAADPAGTVGGKQVPGR